MTITRYCVECSPITHLFPQGSGDKILVAGDAVAMCDRMDGNDGEVEQPLNLCTCFSYSRSGFRLRYFPRIATCPTARLVVISALYVVYFLVRLPTTL